MSRIMISTFFLILNIKAGNYNNHNRFGYCKVSLDNRFFIHVPWSCCYRHDILHYVHEMNWFFQLRFFYHMFGRGIGSLNVYTRETVTGPMNKIWSKSGNVGDYFERVDLVINETRSFQVEMFYIGHFLSFLGFLLFFLLKLISFSLHVRLLHSVDLYEGCDRGSCWQLPRRHCNRRCIHDTWLCPDEWSR